MISVDKDNKEMNVRALDADFNDSNSEDLVLDCSNFNIHISDIKEGDIITFFCFESSLSESKIKIGELIKGTLNE